MNNEPKKWIENLCDVVREIEHISEDLGTLSEAFGMTGNEQVESMLSNRSTKLNTIACKVHEVIQVKIEEDLHTAQAMTGAVLTACLTKS